MEEQSTSQAPFTTWSQTGGQVLFRPPLGKTVWQFCRDKLWTQACIPWDIPRRQGCKAYRGDDQVDYRQADSAGKDVAVLRWDTDVPGSHLIPAIFLGRHARAACDSGRLAAGVCSQRDTHLRGRQNPLHVHVSHVIRWISQCLGHDIPTASETRSIYGEATAVRFAWAVGCLVPHLSDGRRDAGVCRYMGGYA